MTTGRYETDAKKYSAYRASPPCRDIFSYNIPLNSTKCLKIVNLILEIDTQDCSRKTGYLAIICFGNASYDNC